MTDPPDLRSASIVIDGRVMTVAVGRLSRDDLIAIVESLAPVSDAEWARRVPNIRTVTS
jgi:hypothetical protein